MKRERSLITGIMLIVAVVAMATIFSSQSAIHGYAVKTTTYPPELEQRALFCVEDAYGQLIEIDTSEISVETLNRVFGCDTFNREKSAHCTYDESTVYIHCQDNSVVFEFV